jgi:uncharacterized lipoprotein YajG
MQTDIKLQEILRQRRFLSSLIPLFALFVEAGCLTRVSAQSLNTSKILVD